MVQVLPAELAASPALAGTDMRLDANTPMDDAALDHLQGLITRTVRKKLNAEGARSYFRQVDAAANAYFGPWAKAASLPMPTAVLPCNTAAPTKPRTLAAWPMATWSSAGPMKSCCYPARSWTKP